MKAEGVLVGRYKQLTAAKDKTPGVYITGAGGISALCLEVLGVYRCFRAQGA